MKELTHAERHRPQRTSRRRHRRHVGPRTGAGQESCGARRPRRLRRAIGAAGERVAGETGACGIVGDVGRKEDIHPIALEIAWSLGGLDALINNASSLGPTPLALLADTECEDFQRGARSQRARPLPPDQGLCSARSPLPRAKAAAPSSSTSRATPRSTPIPAGAPMARPRRRSRHMTAIWAEEARAEGVEFLSLDPGDMDTPLHALAVPDADPATLKRPEDAAREIVAVAARRARRPRRARARAAPMTAAGRIDRQFAKLLVAEADGGIRHLPRAALGVALPAGRPRRRQ